MGVIGTVATYCSRAAGPRAYVTTVPITPIWSRGKAQATTNLLPGPGKVLSVAKN